MSVRRWLAHRVFALVEEPLRAYLADRPTGHEALERRIAELEADLAALRETGPDKRHSMVMGAIQAVGTQILQLRQDVDRAVNLARQASQQATSAYAMAESAADGVHALESK